MCKSTYKTRGFYPNIIKYTSYDIQQKRPLVMQEAFFLDYIYLVEERQKNNSNRSRIIIAYQKCELCESLRTAPIFFDMLLLSRLTASPISC